MGVVGAFGEGRGESVGVVLGDEFDGLFGWLGSRFGAFEMVAVAAAAAEEAGGPAGVDAFDALGVEGLEAVSCWWRGAGVRELVTCWQSRFA